jgi:N-acetylmuramoyl-L-alanine amidase
VLWRSVVLVAILLLLPASVPAGSPEVAPRRFVVAIDAGHGGSNLGAAAPAGEVFEKRVTLELARRLRQLLGRQPGIEVVLCRELDVLIPIRARARCAEAAKAQLFISLHANASPPGVAPGSRRGFEIYVLSPQEVEDDAAVAALGQADAADAAWAGHQVRAAAELSVLAARTIEQRLKDALGARASRGIRQAGAALDVLRGTGSPGVLVEVGFLDHPDEGPVLASPVGQDRIAAALARAVIDLHSPAPPRR